MPRLALEPCDAWRVVWWVGHPTGVDEVGRALGLAPDATTEQIVTEAGARWGPAAATRFGGGLALAMYAPDADGRVVLVRDRLGVVPLYVARTPAGIVVADTMTEMIELGVPPLPDEEFEAAAGVLAGGGAFDTRSPVRDVRRIPPGYSAQITPGSATIARWWDPTRVRTRRIDGKQAAAELRMLLEEAVSRTITATGRQGVAAHMSGGMDSTTVASLAVRSLREQGSDLVAGISWSPDVDRTPAHLQTGDHTDFDEREVVRNVASELSIPLLFWWPDNSSARWLDDVDEMILPRRTMTVESELITRYADAGISHVLSGWGGDEFVSFNGRRSLEGMWRHGDLVHLWQAFDGLRDRGAPMTRAAATVVGAAIPYRFREPFSRSGRRGGGLVELAEGLVDFPEARERAVALARAVKYAGSPREMRRSLLALGHLSARMESWHEAGRRFGVTYHYPLLDHRLVEWSMSMPAHVLQPDGRPRTLFRRSIEGFVPDSVRTSMKQDPVMWDVLINYKQQQN